MTLTPFLADVASLFSGGWILIAVVAIAVVLFLGIAMVLSRYTKVVNYLGLPSLSVPCGVDPRGLPIGFQLIGKPFGEPELLAVGHRYVQAAGWAGRTPDL